MKKITFLFLFVSTGIVAQDLTLLSGGSMSMQADAVLYANGVELQPTSDFSLDGPIELSSSEIPLSEPKTISRVFELSKPMENFSGNVTFYYANAELNNITEAELELLLKNDPTSWSIIASSLNMEEKKMEFNFENPATIYGLSATTKQTLSEATVSSQDIQIYPNPTQSVLYINHSSDMVIEVYNLLGSSLIKSTQKNIDLSGLSSGTYFVKLTDVATNATTVKQIVKQ